MGFTVIVHGVIERRMNCVPSFVYTQISLVYHVEPALKFWKWIAGELWKGVSMDMEQNISTCLASNQDEMPSPRNLPFSDFIAFWRNGIFCFYVYIQNCPVSTAWVFLSGTKNIL